MPGPTKAAAAIGAVAPSCGDVLPGGIVEREDAEANRRRRREVTAAVQAKSEAAAAPVFGPPPLEAPPPPPVGTLVEEAQGAANVASTEQSNSPASVVPKTPMKR